MKRTNLALRMSLGGAVCGGYLGILAGAFAGVIYGWFVGNLSLGLDGAMVGGAIFAAGGAIYGMVAGVDEGRKKHEAPEHHSLQTSSANTDFPG